MGRRLFAPVVVAIVALGVSAGTAYAKPARPFSNGTGKAPTLRIKNLMLQAQPNTPVSSVPPAMLERSQFKAECTVPAASASSTYTNIYSRDTAISFYGLIVVGTCSADLTMPQTLVAGGTGSVPYNDSKLEHYSQECIDKVPGSGTYYGSAMSITYPDGEFVETCTAYM